MCRKEAAQQKVIGVIQKNSFQFLFRRVFFRLLVWHTEQNMPQRGPSMGNSPATSRGFGEGVLCVCYAYAVCCVAPGGFAFASSATRVVTDQRMCAAEPPTQAPNPLQQYYSSTVLPPYLLLQLLITSSSLQSVLSNYFGSCERRWVESAGAGGTLRLQPLNNSKI